MCGDIETEESLAEAYFSRFVDDARRFLEGLGDGEAGSADPVFAHLDGLFRSALGAAAAPDNAPGEVSGYERLSMEPLVYARLAGFMAAHQPLQEDPLRRLIEALMTGYAEGEAIMAQPAGHAHRHDHAH